MDKEIKTALEVLGEAGKNYRKHNGETISAEDYVKFIVIPAMEAYAAHYKEAYEYWKEKYNTELKTTIEAHNALKEKLKQKGKIV